MYTDKLDDINNESNNTYHSTIKMKPADVKSGTYVGFGRENNDKDPKFKVGDHVIISKYENIFANDYLPNWSEEVFVIKKVKNTAPRTCVIDDLNGEEIAETFYQKELQKTNQIKSNFKKIIKRKGDKRYVKWKGYHYSFNSQINKNDSVIQNELFFRAIHL